MDPPKFSTEKGARERVKAKEGRESTRETTRVAKAKARKEKARMAKETKPPTLLLKPHKTMKAGSGLRTTDTRGCAMRNGQPRR
jgi:hypothetical protein